MALLPRILSLPVTSVGEVSPTLFRASTIEDWMHPQALKHSGCLVERPEFHGKWDAFQPAVDGVTHVVGSGLVAKIPVGSSARQVSTRLKSSVAALLATVSLPVALRDRLHSDACSMGRIMHSLCPASRDLEVKLEIFGENTCERWHQDHFAGRGIVSYTGVTGTEYTRASNVNDWELRHCGQNEHIIRDAQLVESVAVGDMLLIKGTQFPSGAKGLVHRSPPKRRDASGRVINRLVLKVDALSAAQRVAPLRTLAVVPNHKRARDAE